MAGGFGIKSDLDLGCGPTPTAPGFVSQHPKVVAFGGRVSCPWRGRWPTGYLRGHQFRHQHPLRPMAVASPRHVAASYAGYLLLDVLHYGAILEPMLVHPAGRAASTPLLHRGAHCRSPDPHRRHQPAGAIGSYLIARLYSPETGLAILGAAIGGFADGEFAGPRRRPCPRLPRRESRPPSASFVYDRRGHHLPASDLSLQSGDMV